MIQDRLTVSDWYLRVSSQILSLMGTSAFEESKYVFSFPS